MELFILVVLLIVLIETTILLIAHRPKKVFRTHHRRKIYVDTSVLIDGRILAIAQTGFIGDDLIIPRSVIRELQLLADGKDSDKRTRARFGMDIVNELERVVHCETTIFPDELDRTPVDERLLQLAKANHGLILTNDYNLGKVAATEGIDVLNINDLSLVLRTEYLPGERLTIKIIDLGSNKGQGLGYLKDGTMVVVDHAHNFVGQEVEIEFVRFLQTSSGKMMFAKLVSPVTSKDQANHKDQVISSKNQSSAKRPAFAKTKQQPGQKGKYSSKSKNRKPNSKN